MTKRDFSIRYEVEVMLKENLELEMTDEQIDEVVEAIEQHDTFLGVVGLFVTKGIEEVAKKHKLELDEGEIEYQLNANRRFINHSEI